MKTNTLAQFTFAREADHGRFLAWLAAYESDNRIDANARIYFLRAFGIFARWSIACDDHAETIFWAANAHGALAVA